MPANCCAAISRAPSPNDNTSSQLRVCWTDKFRANSPSPPFVPYSAFFLAKAPITGSLPAGFGAAAPRSRHPGRTARLATPRLESPSSSLRRPSARDRAPGATSPARARSFAILLIASTKTALPESVDGCPYSAGHPSSSVHRHATGLRELHHHLGSHVLDRSRFELMNEALRYLGGQRPAESRG